MTKIIALTNQKGGVGKTTSAVNIAASLAVSEIKTLLIDIDPQANTTTGIAKIIEKRAENTIYETLVDEIPIKDTITKTTFNYLDAILSTNDLVGAEIELVSVIARELELKKALAKVKRRYDYIIIDCPPSLSMLTVNALVASKGVIIPIQCEYYALEGLSSLLKTIERIKQRANPTLEVTGLVRTMFDARNNLANQVSRQLINHFSKKVFHSIIPRNVRLAEAPSHGMPIIDYDRASRGSIAYMALASEFLRQQQKNN